MDESQFPIVIQFVSGNKKGKKIKVKSPAEIPSGVSFKVLRVKATAISIKSLFSKLKAKKQ